MLLSANFRHLHLLRIYNRIVRLSPHCVCQTTELLSERFLSTSFLLPDAFAPKKVGSSVPMASTCWNCPNCSFRNFVTRRSCRRCDYSRTEEEINKNKTIIWPCSECNSINYIDRKTCHKCGMSKPENVNSNRGETAADGSWFCIKCGFANQPIRDTCFCCDTMVTEKQLHEVLKRSGIWECGICGNKNYPSKKKCNGCNTARSVK